MEKTNTSTRNQIDGENSSTNFKKNKRPIEWSKLGFIWGWMILPLISWLIFYWYKNISSFVGAFQDMETNAFTFKNFQLIWEEIIAGEEKLDSIAIGFTNTLKYWGVGQFVIFPLNLIYAYFIYKRVPCYKTFRFIFYLPAIIPSITFATVYQQIVAGNGILAALGFDIPQLGLLGTAGTATNTIICYQIWTGLSGNILLVGGAMNRIPPEVLEAAKLDGVKPFREFVQLILPLIWPTLSTLLLMGCCGFLTATGPILLLAPDVSSLRSTTISYWLFTKVWASGRHMQGSYNLVSAAGILLTVVAFPVVMIVRKIIEKVPTVEY